MDSECEVCGEEAGTHRFCSSECATKYLVAVATRRGTLNEDKHRGRDGYGWR